MNGRAYDYNLGRFLSVDPFIQEPGNSQSMNPYSYIMNNPLSGTDPSGYKACDADGSLKGCADDIEPGETKDIEQSQTGSRIKRKVGTIGKDKDGNVYVTSGNGKEGRQSIKGAMMAMESIESIGSQASRATFGMGGYPKDGALEPQDEDQAIIGLRDEAKAKYGEGGTEAISLGGTADNKVTMNIIGTKEFRGLVRKHLRATFRTPDGKKMIDELAAMGVEVDIIASTSALNYNVTAPSGGGNSIIAYNAFSESIYKGATFIDMKGNNLSGIGFRPEMTLAHELYHAGQISGSYFFERGRYAPSFEKAAALYTNQIRVQAGYNYIRSGYNSSSGEIDTFSNAKERAGM